MPGDVLMIKVADKVILSLWDRDHFEAEVGTDRHRVRRRPDHPRPQRRLPRARSTRCCDAARRAGADPCTTAVDREWGGYTGYFGDPDGYRWEVAWAPGEVGAAVLP